MPLWSMTANELFYRTEDGQIMVVTYTEKDGVFKAEKPTLWSDKWLANTGLTVNLDLDPSGKKFAVLTAAEGPEPAEARRHVTLILNFFDEVRRRVSEGK